MEKEIEGTASQQQGEGEKNEFTPITSQEQLDKIIGERVKRVKATPPSDYEELKQKAAQWDEHERESQSELEKAQNDLATVTAERDKLKHDAELAQWKGEVAAESGLPAAILRGDTLEEIKAHAEQIKSETTLYPQVNQGNVGGSSAPVTIEESEIRKMKRPEDRYNARLANLRAQQG